MKERYTVIKELKNKQTIRELCRYLRISRSGYYAYLKRKDKDADEDLKCKIKTIYEQRSRTVGYRRIQDELYRQYRLIVNHKKVLRLMQELDIKAIIRRKYVHRTSYEVAVSDGRIAENLLKRDFKADKPNQKWVTDVTQYRVFDEKIYLSAIKDLWNNEIVGFHISRGNDNPLVFETFRKAFETHKDVTGLIVHRDTSTRPMHTTHAAATGWSPNQHVSPRQLL
ncbi:IS3 family transposase [Paenibacillus sp. FSL L8-0708]|uniref:IS3 family transposase n=1 Tax=Paenibacillus sp. FSL L8-0708 TaxID=2975311 RepID=UPI0030FB9F66